MVATTAVWLRHLEVLKRETYTMYLTLRDPRVPWYAKGVAACAVGYTFSPIQLIPDWVPVLGFADNLLFLSVAVALMRRVTSPAVLAECRERAAGALARQDAPAHMGVTHIIAAVVLTIWLVVGGVGSFLLWRALGGVR